MARGREGGSAQRRALKMRQGPTWEGLCSPVWKSGVEGSGEHRTVRKQAWGVMEVLDLSGRFLRPKQGKPVGRLLSNQQGSMREEGLNWGKSAALVQGRGGGAFQNVADWFS